MQDTRLEESATLCFRVEFLHLNRQFKFRKTTNVLACGHNIINNYLKSF